MDASMRIASFVGTLQSGIPVICPATSWVSMIKRLLTVFQLGEVDRGRQLKRIPIILKHSLHA